MSGPPKPKQTPGGWPGVRNNRSDTTKPPAKPTPIPHPQQRPQRKLRPCSACRRTFPALRGPSLCGLCLSERLWR